MILTNYRGDALSTLACRLYELAAQRPLPREPPPTPAACRPVLECLYWGEGTECPELPEAPPPALEGSGHPSTGGAVVAATGGKDSLAVVLELLSRGVPTRMVHVRGINPKYPHELQGTAEQAEQLECEFTEIKCRIGRKNYVENPAKDAVILLLIASVARKFGGSILAEGLHVTRVAATQPFDNGWSDCVEMARASKSMVEQLCPGVTVELEGWPRSDCASLRYVATHAPHIFPTVTSCMTPVRYHRQLRRANARLLGYELLPGRCGSCYKCCKEWSVLTSCGLYSESTSYREHCGRVFMSKREFCYGPAALEWGLERTLAEFLQE